VVESEGQCEPLIEETLGFRALRGNRVVMLAQTCDEAGGFDWPNNEQTLATSTHIGHCPGMMERPTILKKLVVIERRFYPNLRMTRQLVLYRDTHDRVVSVMA
jgi:hypothetical protein